MIKLIFFLLCCNIILTVYLITECVSTRELVTGLKAQQNTIQILASKLYGSTLNSEYSLKRVIKRNPKLKEKDNE